MADTMEARARAFTRTHGRYTCEVSIRCLADFASQIQAETEKRVREEVGDELRKRIDGIHNGNWAGPLYKYADELRKGA